MRKVIARIVYSLIVMASVFGVVAAVAVPAMASTMRGYECEVSHPVCIGAPNLAWGSTVVETSSGRKLDITPTPDPVYANAYKLRITADTSKCLGVDTSSNSRVIIKTCSNTAIDWQRQQTGSGDNHRWMNIYESKSPGPWGGSQMCLTGYGSAGLSMFINYCGSGIQVFDFSGVIIT